MNGFPNGFYGWGGEDDELAQRTNQTKLSIIRQPGNIARYTMLTHEGVRNISKSLSHCIFEIIILNIIVSKILSIKFSH